MSLIVNLAEYLEDVTSLKIDTNLFVGAELYSSPPGSVIIREIPGGTENESHLRSHAIQVLVSDLSYVAAETLANTVFAKIANMPGFNNVNLLNEHIFYASVLSGPAPLVRDERGNFVFAMSFLLRRR